MRKSGGSYRKDYYNGCTATWGWNADDSPTAWVLICTNGFASTNMAGNGPPPNELDELTDVTLTEEGANCYWTFHRTMEQQIELRAGGKPYAGRVDLVRLHVFEPTEIEYEFPGDPPPPFRGLDGDPIDPTTISVMGSAADTNGYVHELVTPSSVRNLALAVPKASQEMQSAVSQAKLQIIRDGTTDIAGKTNRVVIGEHIKLECKITPEIGTITAWQWEGMRGAVSNYAISGDQRTGQVFYLTNDSDFTTNAIQYYYVKPRLEQVMCSVTVAGKEIPPARTYFKVESPVYSLQIIPSNQVVEVSGYGNDPGNFLHFGNWKITNGVGFYATQELLVETNFVVAFLQIITGESKRWYTDGTRTKFAYTNWLDDPFPYQGVLSNGDLKAFDSPGVEFSTFLLGISRHESFNLFLMYRSLSSSGSNIWVPVITAPWNWGGQGTNFVEAQVQALNGDSVFPTNIIMGSAASDFPVWTKALTIDIDWVPW